MCFEMHNQLRDMSIQLYRVRKFNWPSVTFRSYRIYIFELNNNNNNKYSDSNILKAFKCNANKLKSKNRKESFSIGKKEILKNFAVKTRLS